MNADQIPIPEDLRQLQKEDADISKLYSQVVDAAGKGLNLFMFQGRSFCVMNDLLYRKTGDKLQVVLPVSVRNTVMTLGHSIPWAGHLGRRKTHCRISKHFTGWVCLKTSLSFVRLALNVNTVEFVNLAKYR